MFLIDFTFASYFTGKKRLVIHVCATLLWLNLSIFKNFPFSKACKKSTKIWANKTWRGKHNKEQSWKKKSVQNCQKVGYYSLEW